MKIFFFILFIIINFILIFRVNQQFKPKTAAIAYGISFVVVPILMLAAAYLIRIFNFNADKEFQDLGIALVSTLMMMILLNLVLLFADAMVDKLLNFQETKNQMNTGRNPVLFGLNNRPGIKSFYRIAFFLGSILMFYGIWLGEK